MAGSISLSAMNPALDLFSMGGRLHAGNLVASFCSLWQLISQAESDTANRGLFQAVLNWQSVNVPVSFLGQTSHCDEMGFNIPISLSIKTTPEFHDASLATGCACKPGSDSGADLPITLTN